MFKLDEFIAAARAAAAEEDPAGSLRALLEGAIADGAEVTAAVPATDEAEVVLYDSPELTVYHIQLPSRIHYPPHSHGVTALIGTYRGRELNVLYRREGDRIVEHARRTCETGEVIVLGPDAIHSVVNTGGERSGAVHIYLGDLLRRPRSLWRPDGTGEAPFDERVYFELAAPLAD